MFSQSVNFKDFLRSKRIKENDRGETAAAWSRKLPYASNQAHRMVRTHLSPVEDAITTRHISKLEKAIQEASNGAKYLQTVSIVRRSRSVPSHERHALETALASHIVRAKVELDRWHTGVLEINTFRRKRNPKKLRETLDNWGFAEDEPLVLNAREDLKRWRYMEDHMASVLQRAVEQKDLKAIRSNLNQLSMGGPANVEGESEARSMLNCYDSNVRVLKDAIRNRNVESMEATLANWEFPEDANVKEAQATLELRLEQLRDLKRVVADKHVDTDKLREAVTCWEFETDNDDFRHAYELLQGIQADSEALEDALREAKARPWTPSGAADAPQALGCSDRGPAEAVASGSRNKVSLGPAAEPEEYSAADDDYGDSFSADPDDLQRRRAISVQTSCTSPGGLDSVGLDRPLAQAQEDEYAQPRTSLGQEDGPSTTANDEGYDSELERSSNNQQSKRDGDSEFEAEGDPYGDEFDAEGDQSREGYVASPVSAGISPTKRSYSQEDFENDAMQAAPQPFEGSEEDDFEEGDEPARVDPARLDASRYSEESAEFEADDSPLPKSGNQAGAAYANEFEEADEFEPDDDDFEADD